MNILAPNSYQIYGESTQYETSPKEIISWILKNFTIDDYMEYLDRFDTSSYYYASGFDPFFCFIMDIVEKRYGKYISKTKVYNYLKDKKNLRNVSIEWDLKQGKS